MTLSLGSGETRSGWRERITPRRTCRHRPISRKDPMSPEQPAAVETPTYPSIVVGGSPRERGERYGALAADRVRRSIEGYEAVFAYHAGLDRVATRERAEAYVEPIARYDVRWLEEM